MTTRRWSMRFLAAALATIPAGAALGQDGAAAKALFDKGLADMEAGRYDVACPAIAESLRLDARPGTTFTLAECWAKAGKTASAVAQYRDYLNLFGRMTPEQQAKQQGRDKISRDQTARLTPLVPTLKLSLPPDAPPGTEVWRDGDVLGAPSIGVALPVDPGPHTYGAGPKGSKPAEQTLTIAPSEHQEVVVVVPKAGPTAPGTAASNRGKAQRIAGFVVLGVGGGALVAGAIIGGITVATKSTIEAHCDLDSKVCRDQEGLDAVDSAHATGLASSVLLIAGGAVAVTGLVIALAAPKSAAPPRVGLAIGPTGGAVSFGADF
jgi:hypothetical protein